MRSLRLLLATALLTISLFGQKGQDHWVATWATAQLLIQTPPAPAPANPNPAQAIGARGFNNQTVRMTLRSSIGGQRVRIKLSNAFGGTPLVVGAAHIALREKESQIVAGSDRPLTFGGKPGCTLQPGMVMLSDPVELTVAPLTDLAVSLYFPGDTGRPTNHASGLHTTYISKEGDFSAAPAITDTAATTPQYYWLAAIDVLAPAKAGAVVTFGDSITDGSASSMNGNHNWPSLLAARLAGSKKTAGIGVANVGIGGNRILHDGAGASALARFDRDVLSQSGVKWVMMLEGINDIGHAPDPGGSANAEEIIAAYRQIIERAHAHGIKVIGCTLTPYEGAAYARPAGEEMRQIVNQWIRTGGGFDAFVDFEAAARDPQNPKHINPAFDPGDHLHPNDKGYEAMANSVNLSIFK